MGSELQWMAEGTTEKRRRTEDFPPSGIYTIFRHQHIYPLLRTRWTWELHQLRFLFSIFEEQNSCYASDSILCGYVGTVISVKLEACNFSSILFRQLINGRGYHPVWTTPWCNGVSLAMTMLFQLESVTARTAK
ncbi:hypothetical protein GLYMA_14G119732v4 [Glycine max]|nr:hypothetical protein GLYMA_14G119732v4 [Glycine max]